jgi:hypothetical protein
MTEPRPAPRISFVSLGCPKALVDSERIITRLRAEGYELTRTHAGADAVIVNTCGFLDSAKAESLQAIGAAMNENGKVIVTGCMGAEPDAITAQHDNLLAITGPQAYESVMEAVHKAVPPAHDPFLDLVPPQGVKLTPRHYAYLKISEGCNNRCSFCIIPKLRGDLVSRPAAEVLREAEKLVKAGVKELLVVSQDTSAYGVDLKYAESRFADRDVRAPLPRSDARTRLARRMGAPALRLPLSACRRGHRADGRGQGAALSRHPVPARQPERAAGDEAAGQYRQDARPHQGLARRLPRSRHPLDLHRRLPRRDGGRFPSSAARLADRKRSSIASAHSNTSRSPARRPTISGWSPCRARFRSAAGSASWRRSRRSARKSSGPRSASGCPSSSTRPAPTARRDGRNMTRPRSTARCMSPAAGLCAPATS